MPLSSQPVFSDPPIALDAPGDLPLLLLEPLLLGLAAAAVVAGGADKIHTLLAGRVGRLLRLQVGDATTMVAFHRVDLLDDVGAGDDRVAVWIAHRLPPEVRAPRYRSSPARSRLRREPAPWRAGICSP